MMVAAIAPATGRRDAAVAEARSLGELGAAGGAASGLELTSADGACRASVDNEVLPSAEDRILERRPRWLEQAMPWVPYLQSRFRGLGGQRGHEMLLKTPTTRPRMVASRVLIAFMLLFSG